MPIEKKGLFNNFIWSAHLEVEGINKESKPKRFILAFYGQGR